MKHVYVFGAGASADSAKTPLGKDLVWNYPLDCGLLISDLQDLQGENERFSNYREFLKLAASIYPEYEFLLREWDNRNYMFFDTRGILNKRLRNKRHYADEILTMLQQKGDTKGVELVRRLIFEHLAESSIDSENLQYKRFIDGELKSSNPGEVTIISFNFDVLLHEDFDANVYFDYLLKFDWIDDNRKKFYAQNNPIKLIKLNGSMDWGICPCCNRLHLYYPFMHSRSFDNKQCENCGHRIQPLIIIPHESYPKMIQPLWSSAREELKQACLLTVIGYSFPEYDCKVRNLFSTSVGAQTKLQVVDCCCRKEDEDSKRKTILMKYKRLFPMLNNEIDIHLYGFRGYLDNHTA